MFIELERVEHAMLLELIQARIEELTAGANRNGGEQAKHGPEIASLGRLLHKLHEAEWEVTC